MRCTSCSEVVKPVVAIDIDGTLGDYHLHFMRFASLYLGMHDGYLNARNYYGEEPFKQWFCRVTDESEQTWSDIKLAYRQGAQKRSMPVYRGAKELVRSLKLEGAEIWLTTTRPYLRLDNIDPDTRFWLELHGITWDYILYDPDKYKLLAQRVDPGRVVAVLDDEVDQYQVAAKTFGHDVAILRRNMFNFQARPKIWWNGEATSVGDLEEAREMIIRQIQIWRKADDK